MRGQVQDVLRARAQGCDVEADDVQAVVEVGAEAAGRDLQLQVAVGGGDDAHVHGASGPAADRGDVLLLHEAQEAALRLERQLADLVEQQRAVVGLHEAPELA